MNVDLFKQAVPSGRDFEVYRRVRIQEVSTRAVAGEYGLSQTRVVQIASRVEQYLRATGIGADDKELLDAKLGIVQYQAAQRIRYVMSQMMRAMEASLAGKKMLKRTESGDHRPTKTILSTANCADECRYAMTIARLSQMQAKMPVDAFINTVCEVAEEIAEEESARRRTRGMARK